MHRLFCAEGSQEHPFRIRWTTTYFQESGHPNFLDKAKMPCKSKKEERAKFVSSKCCRHKTEAYWSNLEAEIERTEHLMLNLLPSFPWVTHCLRWPLAKTGQEKAGAPLHSLQASETATSLRCVAYLNYHSSSTVGCAAQPFKQRSRHLDKDIKDNHKAVPAKKFASRVLQNEISSKAKCST